MRAAASSSRLYGRIVLGSFVLLSMTAAYVATCAPAVAVETTRTAFVVPNGAPSAVTTLPICVISSGGSVRVVVPSVEPSRRGA